MVRFCSTGEIVVVAFLIIQMVNASPLGMCSCSTCPKDNFYNCALSPPPCSCTNYEHYQNSLCPNNAPSLCPYCSNSQNADVGYGSSDTGPSCGCPDAFSYDTQIPPNASPLPPRCSYTFSADTPPVSCPQTFKNFGYQLQVPETTKCEPNFGLLDTVIGKTYKKCPSSCKPLC